MRTTFDVWEEAFVFGKLAEEAFNGSTNLVDRKIRAHHERIFMGCEHTIVFFPMSTTPLTSLSPLKLFRILCICWELTLSTWTMKMELYSSNKPFSLSKYADLVLVFPPMSSLI